MYDGKQTLRVPDQFGQFTPSYTVFRFEAQVLYGGRYKIVSYSFKKDFKRVLNAEKFIF
jgi:hypothetical protein